MAELKPCPFCGGEAVFIGDTATIKCKSCGGAFIVTNLLISKKKRKKHGTGGLTMATIKCPIGKRGRATHEWNDGVKDRIYCMGWVDRMTDDPLPECLACPDHVSHAQDDLDSFYKEQEG